MLLKLFGDFSDLSPHMTRINAVEDWHHGERSLVFEIHDLHELVEAPSGRCVIHGDNNDGEFGLLDGAYELRRNPPATSQLLVVLEGSNVLPTQFFVEKTDEVAASVGTSETQKDIELWERSCCSRHLIDSL